MKRKVDFQLKNELGFTLIEILVVLAIIGVLTTIALPNFMGARQRARDAVRKSDIRQIQKALELYKNDQVPPAYPTSYNNVLFPQATCAPTPWIENNTTYMPKVPCDPLGPTPYYYQSPVSGDNLKYILRACLENKSDPDGTTAPATECTSEIKYEVTEP